MHWFRRPPYFRWMAAALVLSIGVAAELAERRTIQHPFAAADLAAGAVIAAGDVVWRPMPPGDLPPVDPIGEVAAGPVLAGEPLRPSDLTAAPAVPAGWWSVPVRLPAGARPGGAVRLVSDDPPVASDGVVVRVGGRPELLSEGEEGLVAVPPGAATDVAAAASRGALVVLLGN